MHKKQVLICPPRTGSMYYCDKLSKLYNIDNLGEIFANTLTEEMVPTENYLQVIDNLKLLDNWIIKIIPWQLHSFVMYDNKLKSTPNTSKFIDKQIVNTILSIIDISDKHYFLYRENFVEQVESYALASISDQWLDNRSSQQLDIDETTVTNCKNKLLYQYNIIKQVYTSRPGELVSLEQFGTNQERYPNRTIGGNSMESVAQIDILDTYFKTAVNV